MSMKTKAAFHLVLFGLACWALISYFETSEGIASFFGTKSGGMVFDLNLTPFILFVAASAVYLYLQKKATLPESSYFCLMSLKSRMKESR